MAHQQQEDIERTCVNDLRLKDYVILPGKKLMKIKEIKKSKTGKHGGCKVHLKGVDVFSGKNVDHMINSSDDMDKIKPRKTVGWTLLKICDEDDEPSVILQNKKLKRGYCHLFVYSFI